MNTDLSTAPNAGATPDATLDAVDALLDQAEAAIGQGLLDPAVLALDEVLRLDPLQFDALHLLGVIAMQRRDFPACIDFIQRAIAVDAEMAMAHVNLGVACLETQRRDEALAAFDAAIALEPDFPQAHFGRGVVLLERKQWDDAIACFAKALALQPGNTEAHLCQGNAYLGLMRFDDALASYRAVLALQPQHVPALINAGHAYVALNRCDEAIGSYEQALGLQANSAAALGGLGDAYQSLQRFDEAVVSYGKALALQPDQARLLGNRANALLALKRLPEAINNYEQALQLTPDDATVRANFAGALRSAERWDEALLQCDRALEIDHNNAGAYMNRGNALLDLGRLTPAREAFAKSHALQPEDAEAQWGQGWCDLLMGDWARGLPQFEWRWRKNTFSSAPRSFNKPLWLGEQALRGRTLYVHAEQGLGDTLHFARYVPEVIALGARVIIEVQPALKGLMRTLAGGAQVIGKGDGLFPAFDYHCPLMSLPLAFKSTPENVPAPKAYLSANPDLVRALGERMGDQKQPRIGLVWSGNAAHRNDRHRSMALATVLAALPPGLDLYCLQKDIRDNDLATLKAHPEIRHFEDVLQTFDGTAALIEQLDLVITVDTSIAHLAGALGKPTWILLSKMPDWRWLLNRSDSPWYPSARLFRQTTWGQWSEPLSEVSQALRSKFTH